MGRSSSSASREPHAPGPGVDHEIADGRGDAARTSHPSQLGADASEQLGELERLGDVVDRAGVEADDDVELLVACREHHDRGRRVGAVDRPADVEPVEIGQAQVEQHQVGRIVLGGFDRGPTGAGPRGRVPRCRVSARRSDAPMRSSSSTSRIRSPGTAQRYGADAAPDPRRGSGANMAVPSPSVRLPLAAAIRTVDRVNERIRLGLLAVLGVAVAACQQLVADRADRADRSDVGRHRRGGVRRRTGPVGEQRSDDRSVPPASGAATIGSAAGGVDPNAPERCSPATSPTTRSSSPIRHARTAVHRVGPRGMGTHRTGRHRHLHRQLQLDRRCRRRRRRRPRPSTPFAPTVSPTSRPTRPSDSSTCSRSAGRPATASWRPTRSAARRTR